MNYGRHEVCQLRVIRSASILFLLACLMNETMRKNHVFFPLTSLSHRREVAPWQILTMTTPTMSRRFGVEIEFLSTITTQQAVTSLRAAGIRVESSHYTHDTTPYWKIVVERPLRLLTLITADRLAAFKESAAKA